MIKKKLSNEKNESHNDENEEENDNDSSELDELIDFKLGDELCVEPDEPKKNVKEFNIDNEVDNDLELPMRKIMERVVERPTIGVPPPGTDPNDDYYYQDDCNNGVFQTHYKGPFDNDQYDDE